MKLAGIIGNLASFCSQHTMNGLALMSHFFYSPGTKDPSGTGSTKHKYTEVFAFACGSPIKFCALHVWFIYFFFSPPSRSSVVSVTLTFTARCHSFSFSLLCHEADVTDQCARQLCLMCKAPRYKGKCGVRPVLGSACFTPAAASCHAPSCFTSPNAQGVLPSWDLTLRDYAHRAIKKMSGQQLIYNMFRLGTPCGTVKAGSKGENKNKCCAKAIVNFTFCF